MRITIFTTLILAFIGLSLNAQTISINPTSGNRGQSLPVTITGVGTNFTRGSNTVSFVRQGTSTSAVVLTNLTVISNTLMGGLLNIASNATVGAYRVQVTNTQNGTINLPNGFTVNNATSTGSLLSITPNTGKQGENLSVSITGLNTSFSAGSNTVKFFSQGTESFEIYELSSTPVSNNLLNAAIAISPLAPTGTYSIGVENPTNGLLMLNNSFTVAANTKSISNVTPNNGKQGQTLSVSITGIDTKFNMGSPTFYFMQQGSPTFEIEVFNVTATSATSANATISIDPNATLGSYNIFYFNELDGSAVKLNAFTVSPTIGVKKINALNTVIYPNPTSKLLYIESEENIEEISIYDLMGKEINRQTPEKASLNYQLNLSELLIPKGIYFIKTRSNNASSTQKIILE